MSKILIIDTFGLIFRAYHAYPMLTTTDGRPTNAIYGFMQMLLNSIEKFNPDALVCSLESESQTFRSKLDTNYKANRKEPDDELKFQIREIVNIIERLGIKTLFKDGYEADDVIGSFAKQCQDYFDKVEIITGDKDLLQLINEKVKVFIPGKTFSDLVEYDRKKFQEKFGIDLDDFVLYKSLVGDLSDNIKGVPGIGPKTAAQIVNKFHSVESIIANVDDLPPKIAESIIENQDPLKRYFELCTIKTDIPINLIPEDTKICKLNVTALRKIIEEYELKSLSTKIAKFIDNFEKKYGGFGLFDLGVDTKVNEVSYVVIENVKFDTNVNQLAFLLKSKTGYLIGDGYHFQEISDNEIYNFIILKKIKKFVGFDLKEFIKLLLSLGVNHIEKFEFIDLKLAWHLIKNYITFESINEISKFLKQDSYFEILKITESEIKKSQIEKLFELEKKLQIVLAQMEFEGINCNVDTLKKLEKEYNNKIALIKQNLFKLVGFEFNPASTKELGHILFEVLKLPVFKKNKTGYSTDDNTLTKLEGMSEIIPMIKEFRFYSKILSTYIKGFQNFCGEDGKIHTTFVQDQVATGRLSSINPNLQNLPTNEVVGNQIRKAFEAKEGIFLSLDYSQIDLRVLAFESKDKRLIQAFENDEDIHEATAKLIFEKSDISKEERRFAKTINFGIVYGMESYGLSQTLKIDQKEAKEFIDKYFEKFPGVREYFDRISKQLDEKSYVNTFLGRRRYFPGWKTASGMQKKTMFREAINMPIQGGTSEIMKMAMVRIFETIQKERLEVKLLLQIHDELVFKVIHEKQLNDLTEKFKNIMVNIYDIGIPLKVSSKFGKDLSFS